MAKGTRGKTTKAKAKKPAAVKVRPGKSNLVDPAMKEAFAHDVDQWQRLTAGVEAASKKLKTFEKGPLKNDGFTVKQIKDAVLMATPQGMAQFEAEIANRLLAAAYIGAKPGEQLGFFLPNHGKVDSVKQARDEGEAASIGNKPMRTDYAPETKEYKAFVKGYQDHQAQMVRGGISKLDKAKAATVAAEKGGKKERKKPEPKTRGKPLTPAGITAAADRAEAKSQAKDGGPPRAGVGMTSSTHFADEDPATKH